MTAIRTRALLALALSGAVALPATAGESPWTLLSPWTLNRSGYYLQMTTSYLSTSDFYDDNGVKQTLSGVTYRDLTANMHLEYGLRNKTGWFL